LGRRSGLAKNQTNSRSQGKEGRKKQKREKNVGGDKRHFSHERGYSAGGRGANI